MGQDVADENEGTLKMNLANNAILVAADVEDNQIIDPIGVRVHGSNVCPLPPACAGDIVVPGIKRGWSRLISWVPFTEFADGSPRDDVVASRRLPHVLGPVYRHTRFLATTSQTQSQSYF